jgi:hypothetical protein
MFPESDEIGTASVADTHALNKPDAIWPSGGRSLAEESVLPCLQRGVWKPAELMKLIPTQRYITSRKV